MLLETKRLSYCFILSLTNTSAGILAVALAGLKCNGLYGTEKAVNLVFLLRCLVSSRFLLNIDKAENVATLLRMQGLSRISGLLCSVSSPLAASANDVQEGVLLLPFFGPFCTGCQCTNCYGCAGHNPCSVLCS